jgi:Protein of unknown function (DUF2934)
MSSKSNGNESMEIGAPPTQPPKGCAYEVYLERGGQPGLELDDWLQAKLELGNGGSR